MLGRNSQWQAAAGRFLRVNFSWLLTRYELHGSDRAHKAEGLEILEVGLVYVW